MSTISATDHKALALLADLLAASEAEYATEQQWRVFCDRPELVKNDQYEVALDENGEPRVDANGRTIKQPVDNRARGFNVGKMLEAGVIVETKIVFHTPRNGHSLPPVSVYKPA